MLGVINNPWIAIAALLIITLGWIVLLIAKNISDNTDIALGHSWSGMEDLRPQGPQLGVLPFPCPRISFYDQLVYQLNFNPLEL